MNIKLLIRKILNEVFLNEAVSGIHFLQRYVERIEDFKNIEKEAFINIEKVISRIKFVNFPPKYSFAIFVTSLNIDKNSKNYFGNKKNNNYYKIDNPNGIGHSIGNEIWIIIRNNKIITSMLRKHSQTTNSEENRTNLNVDFVINNIESFVKDGLFDINTMKYLISKGYNYGF